MNIKELNDYSSQLLDSQVVEPNRNQALKGQIVEWLCDLIDFTGTKENTGFIDFGTDVRDIVRAFDTKRLDSILNKVLEYHILSDPFTYLNLVQDEESVPDGTYEKFLDGVELQVIALIVSHCMNL